MFITYKNPGFEHSLSSILAFQKDDTTPYWANALLYYYPQVGNEKLSGYTPAERQACLEKELRRVWDEAADELDRKVDAYNRHFIRYREQIEDALSEAFEMDTKAVFNDLTGNICLNPICPRYLLERCFDVFYRNSERGALGLSLHEIIHYLWFHVWNRHFHDGYEEYETPSLKWILSEMVVESIMDDPRLSSINPYYPRESGGCVYSYFQDMVIDGRPILDTLRGMRRAHRITDYMEASYRYCRANEASIREHIELAEKAN